VFLIFLTSLRPCLHGSHAAEILPVFIHPKTSAIRFLSPGFQNVKGFDDAGQISSSLFKPLKSKFYCGISFEKGVRKTETCLTSDVLNAHQTVAMLERPTVTYAVRVSAFNCAGCQISVVFVVSLSIDNSLSVN
jgi:hypothetical protein